MTTLPVLGQPQTWVRGDAFARDGHIELDPATITAYSPFDRGVAAAMLFDLTAALTIGDAVRFATRYGLLHHGPDATEHREPFSRWPPTTSKLRSSIELYRLIHESRTDETALHALSERLKVLRGPGSPDALAFLETYE